MDQIFLKTLKNDANDNITYSKQNWAYQIKITLESLGLNHLWINQDTCTINLKMIRQRIFYQYRQSWYSSINNSNRLETYCRFKHNFNLEPYLVFISDRKYKIALSRFRLSSHKLEIERGRHRDINRDERKCKMCTLNVIENENHFLLVCPKYYDLRRKFSETILL